MGKIRVLTKYINTIPPVSSRISTLRFILLVTFYLILRIALGPHLFLISVFIFILLVLRIPIVKITFILLFLAIVFYIIGYEAEANRNMSFIYLFIMLVILKYIYNEVRKK